MGINDKEIAPFDIYQAMNTKDRDTYDREVTWLRNQRLLEQIRTNIEAKNIANKEKKDKQKITRIKVVIPSK